MRAVRLAGAAVGVIVDVHGVDTIEGTLTVRDLAADRVLHTARTDWQVPDIGDRLVTYVLAASGNVAWATETSRARHFWAIHRAVGPQVTTLDRGLRVRPWSLRLRGTTLEWIDGHTRRTASLP